jgi:hypothetical protein
MDDVMITLADARAFGFCVKGIRTYFQTAGLDIRVFKSPGYPASVLEPTGPQCVRLAAFVRARRG